MIKYSFMFIGFIYLLGNISGWVFKSLIELIEELFKTKEED